MGWSIRTLGRLIRPAPRRRAARRSDRCASLQVESLENRQLLSASPGLHALAVPAPHLDPIQARYASLGGAHGTLGKSLSGEMATPYAGGLYEKFQHGAIFYSAKTGAHVVDLATENAYFATGREKDAYGTVVEKILGLPIKDETSVPWLLVAKDTSFQSGSIWWSAKTGAHALYGGIGAEYAATASETNAYGTVVQKILGLPTSEEVDVPGVKDARMTTFQGGTIYWTKDASVHGAHAVYGAIGAEYAATASETNAYGTNVQSILGLPTSDEMDVPGVKDARMTTFQGGTIYWTKDASVHGAHAVYGAIGAEYAATASETNAYGTNVKSILGLPTSDEMDVPGVKDARMTTFQGGTIYWTKDSSVHGAHAVYGAIGAEYAATANETNAHGTNVKSILGLPTSDEMDVPGVKDARMTTFQGGTIYWTKDSSVHGAHVVYGAIGAKYAATANETDFYGTNVQSILGLPTSDEMNTVVAGGRLVTFQHGNIYWSSDSNVAHVVYGAILAQYATLGYERLLGLPTSDENAFEAARYTNFQNGSITWDSATGATRANFSFTDIVQGNSNTCWIAASIAEVLHNGVNLGQRIVYLGNNQFQVSLFNRDDPSLQTTHNYHPVTEIVTYDGSLFAADPSPAWAVVLQRGIIEAISTWDPSQSIANPHSGGARDALAVLTGQWGFPDLAPTAGGAEQTLRQDLEAGYNVVLHTKGTTSDGLVAFHVYAVLGMSGDSVTLFNPWGNQYTATYSWQVLVADGLDIVVN